MPIFEAVRALLRPKGMLSHDKEGHDVDLELQVATVVLLLETAYGDHEYIPRERDAIRRGIKREFGIGEDQAVDLMARAERMRGGRADMASIAAKVTEQYDLAQRKRIVDLIWQVIFADLVVDAEEVALAEQIAGMTGLTHEESLESRRKAFVWFSENRGAT